MEYIRNTDTFTVEGNTSATLANVKATGTSGTIDTSQTPWTFNGLEAKDTITITAQYTIQPGDTEIVNTVTSAQEDDDEEDNTVTITVPTVTIAPANITIYTGGKGYGGVMAMATSLLSHSPAACLSPVITLRSRMTSVPCWGMRALLRIWQTI